MPATLLFENKLNHPVYKLSALSLIIPVYQRQYKWDKVEVENLLEDIYSSFSDQSDSTFWLGTVLLSQESTHSWRIVDGQQRIMTCFWIFKIFFGNDFRSCNLINESKNLNIYSENENFLFDDIVTFLESKHDDTTSFLASKRNKKSYKHKFIELTKLINDKKNDIVEKQITLSRFINYLKEKVQLAIITVKSGYQHFENINSKSVRLDLTEKCLAFLAEKQVSIIKENAKLFSWLMSDKPHEKDGTFNTNVFFDHFIDSFCKNEANHKDKFIVFKNFFSQKQQDQLDQSKLDIFANFLKETHHLIKSKNKSFDLIYLNRICFADYWMIYVKAKVNNYSDILEFFRQNMWKVDLVKHLYEPGRSSTTSFIMSFIKNLDTDDLFRYVEFLVELVYRKKKIQDIEFKNDCSKIKLRPGNKKRLKVLLYLFYWPKKNKESFFQFMQDFDEIDLDHIQPQKGEWSGKLDNIQSLVNLQLLSALVNEKCSDKSISDKLDIMNETEENDKIKYSTKVLKENTKKVIKHWKDTQKNKKRCQEDTKVEYFWNLREQDLKRKMNDNNKFKVNLQRFRTPFIRKQVVDLLKKELHWKEEPSFSDIFKNEDGQFVVLQIANYNGRSGYRVSLSEKTIDFLVSSNNLSDVLIFAFHLYEEKLFCSKQSIKFLNNHSDRLDLGTVHLSIKKHFDTSHQNCSQFDKHWSKTSSGLKNWNKLSEKKTTKSKKPTTKKHSQSKHLPDSAVNAKSNLKNDITLWLEKKLKLTKAKINASIYKDPKDRCIIFRMFNSTGDKNSINSYRISLTKKIIDFLVQEKIKETIIIGFHPINQEFFYSEKTIQDLQTSLTESKDDYVHLKINRHFDQSNKECQKLNQKRKKSLISLTN